MTLPPQDISSSYRFRVVSWNVELGIDHKQAAKDLLDIAELRHADIVLLQEMDEPGTAAIAAELDASYVYNCAAKHPKTGRDFGNAIVSRWPISEVKMLPLPHVALIQGVPRSACRAQVAVNRTILTAYSLHAEIATMRLAKRVQQFETVADDVNQSATDYVVVGGDFNTVTTRSIAALTKRMNAAGLRHASNDSGPSFRRAGQDMRLDHIFAGTGRAGRSCHGDLLIVASGVARNASASDHLPVWVELDLAAVTPPPC